MKLKVGDKNAFNQWHDQIIRKISEPNSRYLDEARTNFLHVQKLGPLALERVLKEIEIPATIRVEEVIHLLTGKSPISITNPRDRLERRTEFLLYCLSANRYPLDPSKMLTEYDIQEGDLLLLDQYTEETDIGVLGWVALARGPKELFDYCNIVRTSKDIESSRHTSTLHNPFSHGSPVESILLYTDEDTELAQYIRYNFSALNEMTDHYLHIYTIEQPTKVKGISTREYWRALVDEATYSLLHLMGWTKYKPYNKAEAYKIAAMLEVYPDALPCIVIFENIKSDEKIVITISGEIKTFFRGLSKVLILTKKKSRETGIDLHDNFGYFKRLFIENWGAWQKEVGEKLNQRTVFTFNGQTVFINRPSGQLDIKDFQNR